MCSRTSLEFYFHIPAVYVVDFAVADGVEGVVELLGDGAGLAVAGNHIFGACVKVVDFTYRGSLVTEGRIDSDAGVMYLPSLMA